MTEGMELPLAEGFYTVQGEGYHAGKAAYFIRLGGCDVGCGWCDSKFSWNADVHPVVSVDKIVSDVLESGARSAVVTGGEPLMWNLDLLCKILKKNHIATFLETSGSHSVSGIWDWICLSPKQNRPPEGNICTLADELKIIVEDVADFDWAESFKMKVKNNCRLFLQPEWSRFDEMIPSIVEYVKQHQEWKISLQIHKYMHIP